MAFIEKLSERIASGATSISNSAKKAGDTARLNNEHSQNKRRIDELYYMLGMVVMQRQKEKLDDKEALGIADEIEKLIARNEDITVELSALKGRKFCVGCGADISAESLYCPECGTRNELPAPEAVIVESQQPVQPVLAAAAPVAAIEVKSEPEPAAEQSESSDDQQSSGQQQGAEPQADKETVAAAAEPANGKICGKCGRHEKPQAVFCSGCGNRLA